MMLDCCQYCCHGHGQLPTQGDKCGTSAQHAATAGRFWTVRPCLQRQMLSQVSACPLHARSGSKPGELTVTPGEANTAPELGRTSSPGAGQRPSKLGLVLLAAR